MAGGAAMTGLLGKRRAAEAAGEVAAGAARGGRAAWPGKDDGAARPCACAQPAAPDVATKPQTWKARPMRSKATGRA